MNRRYPRYPDDADYTTNAPSYYEDLARKNKLIKLLAKKIWEYDKTLNMKLEEIEKVLEEMIYKIGDGFNEEIYDLLVLWIEDGTLDFIINETLMNKKADKTELNKTNLLLSRISHGVSVLEYGAIGDGITDDSLAFEKALQSGSKYVYAPSKENQTYTINKSIEIPEGVFLDFLQSSVLFNSSDSCFILNRNSRIENISYLNVPSNIEMNKAIFYFDGRKQFIVGENKQCIIRNINVNRELGEFSYQGTVFHLHLTQNNQEKGSFISGIEVSNITITRFRYGILNEINVLNTSKVNNYINSNVFENIKSFNTEYLIHDKEMYGNNTQINNNTYRKITFQPSDDQMKIPIYLRGNYNEINEFSFWDNERILNNIQIILDGSYNKISGQNMPPFNSKYFQDNGRYNTIEGSTYGTPSYYTSNVVASRSLTTMFQEKYGSVPFLIESNYDEINSVNGNTLDNSNTYQSFNFNIKESRLGKYKIIMKSYGDSNISESHKPYFGVKINNKYLIGGLLNEIITTGWKTKTTLYLNIYEDEVIIHSLLELKLNDSYDKTLINELTIQKKEINNLLFENVFSSNIENALTKKISDININVPY